VGFDLSRFSEQDDGLMSDVLELTGFDDLDALIERLPDLALIAGGIAMEDALLFLHGQIPPYPGPALTGQTVKFMTAKARAWFFANLRSGKLKLPYARTGTLGRSFTERTTVGADAVIGEIGTNVNYAPWVVGPSYPGQEINGRTMYQAKIHSGRWWQFEQAMTEAEPAAYGVFDDSFRQAFTRMIEEVPHAN
jgi:hypothetical protein